MQKSIAVVVVTYNRLNLLQECIKSLQSQTYKADKIIVINNGSTDGTTEWLQSQIDLEVVHQNNLGGAGGFCTGINHAFNHGYDYIWVMDDDVEPDIDCLETLVKAFVNYGDRYDVLLSDRFYDEERRIRWKYGTEFNFKNPFKSLDAGKGISATDYPNLRVLPIVAFPFEGPMFKRVVIEKVGSVERDFFIIHDDTDYSVRVVNAGFKIGVVTDAFLPRKISLT